ncbi:unnamed protein product [Adineta steineri]|uniref:Uncharacterized protein n=2 Tax=Adineta steineri TaxID=433720 RepID=A0A813W716_9BILA|nr:unnamed protein product [Adineta steineri]
MIFVQLRREYTDRDTGIIIVYNRVPKCGSTLLVRIFQILSNRTRAFTFRQSQELRHYRYSTEEQHTLVTDLVRYSYNVSYQRIVYEQHFHFVNLPSTSKNIFYYINQLRDPLERTLSEFDFERYIGGSSGAGHANLFLHPSLRNLTMDECVSTGDPTRCLTKLYGVYSPISFFCGQSSFCDDTVTRPTSDAALSQAKSNIERYYIHIGILEYIQSSLELLEHIQPSIFTGVVDIYLNVFNSGKVFATPNKYRHMTSNKTRSILRQLLRPEYELYNFVRSRFIDHYTQVFHRTPNR